jgi:hypothetical protein
VGSPLTVGAGTVSHGLFAVLVGLLPVLLDVAPAEVGLLVMQPSCPVVCLGCPVACLGGLLPFPLYVSVGSLLELRRAAHVLGRITVRRFRSAAYRIAVLVQFPRPCLVLLNLLGGVASTVTGLARPLACLGHGSEAPLGSLVVVASARWNRHTDQHRSTADTTRRPVDDARLLGIAALPVVTSAQAVTSVPMKRFAEVFRYPAPSGA